MFNTCSVVRHILEGCECVGSIHHNDKLSSNWLHLQQSLQMEMASVNDFFITASPVCTLLYTDVLCTPGLKHNAFCQIFCLQRFTSSPLSPMPHSSFFSLSCASLSLLNFYPFLSDCHSSFFSPPNVCVSCSLPFSQWLHAIHTASTDPRWSGKDNSLVLCRETASKNREGYLSCSILKECLRFPRDD